MTRVERAVAFCRLMGNPLAYGIVQRLGKSPRRPMELARSLKVSPTAVVNQLSKLRLLGLVRSKDTGVRRKGRKTVYLLGDVRVASLLEHIEGYLKRASKW